ncbi:MAG: hypothetical protein KGV57_01865 [Fusobacterium sp.]|nr:hypothetical protein [Fusobacterium sp.]
MLKNIIKILILIAVILLFMAGMRYGGSNNTEVVFMFFLCTMPIAVTFLSWLLFFRKEDFSFKLVLKLVLIFISMPLAFFISLYWVLSQINR